MIEQLEPTIKLADLQTVAQFGAGVTFLLMGAIPYFQERVRGISSDCMKQLEFCNDPKNPREFYFRNLAKSAADLNQLKLSLFFIQKFLNRVVSFSNLLFVIPALSSVTVLILYPFVSELKVHLTMALFIVICWLPGVIVLTYIYARISSEAKKLGSIVSYLNQIKHERLSNAA